MKPIEKVREIARASDRWGSGSAFIGGLKIGAFIGAAIAGSTIWERRRHRRSSPAQGSGATAARPKDESTPG